MLIRSLALAVLATVAVAAPAAAAPQVTGAVAYFRPLPSSKDSAATVVVFRTAAALPFKVAGSPSTVVSIDGDETSVVDVSPSLHCYEARVYGGRVGKSVSVRIGRDGVPQTLTVQPLAPDIARGGTLGCGADPAAGAVLFGLYPEPMVEPGRWFFTANSGPYLRDLVWTGWGSPTATATGTYVSDCASCGRKQRYPVTVTVDRLVDCPQVGAQAYGRFFFERASGRRPSDPSAKRRTLATETHFYC